MIPDAPGEFRNRSSRREGFGAKAYDAASVENAIKAKGGTSKLMQGPSLT
jgi:hypothetical protein